MKRFHQRSISFTMAVIYLLLNLFLPVASNSRSTPFLQTAATECPEECSCCSKLRHHAEHDSEAAVSAQGDAAPAGTAGTVSISSCPCDRGEELTFSGGTWAQHILVQFVSLVSRQPVTQFVLFPPERFVSRYVEPPYIPPKSVAS